VHARAYVSGLEKVTFFVKKLSLLQLFHMWEAVFSKLWYFSFLYYTYKFCLIYLLKFCFIWVRLILCFLLWPVFLFNSCCCTSSNRFYIIQITWLKDREIAVQESKSCT
jgi:hypothetical protein